MTLPRYIAILGQRDPFGVRRAIIEKAREQRGMTCVLAAPGLTLYSDAPAPLMLADTAGAILGPIFTIPPARVLCPRPVRAKARRWSLAVGTISSRIAGAAMWPSSTMLRPDARW